MAKSKYIINGGLELKPREDASSSSSSEEKNVEVETNFDPVLSMLTEPSSVLDLITASSLKGFIFKLEVPDGKSRYTEYNLETRTQVEVKNFALKLVVISDIETPIGLFGTTRKYSDTEKLFTAEAMMQQEIWKETYLTEGGEIAPSVGNITFLEGGDSIVTLLNYLKQEDGINSVTLMAIDALDFLIDVFEKNKGYKLGILLMKNYSRSKPFNDYIDVYNSARVDFYHRGGNLSEFKEAKQKYLTVRQNILIKVLRLALLGYIHLDLHGGNSLNTDNSTVIIDYGRAVSIKNSDGTFTIDKYINYIGENAVDASRKPVGYDIIKGAINANSIFTDKHSGQQYMLKELIYTADSLFESLKWLGKTIEKKPLDLSEMPKKFLEDTFNHIARLDAFRSLLVSHYFRSKMIGILQEFPEDFTIDDLYGNGFFERIIQETNKIPLIKASTVKASLAIESKLERDEEEEEKEKVTKTKPTSTIERDDREEQLAKPKTRVKKSKSATKSATKSKSKSKSKSTTKSATKSKPTLATIKEREDEDDHENEGLKPKLGRSQKKEVAKMFALSSGGKTIKKRVMVKVKIAKTKKKANKSILLERRIRKSNKK